MKNEMDYLIEAVGKIADTSFEVVTKTFGTIRIAERRSGSDKKGFHRPGERAADGAPFEVTPTKCPNYSGPPSGRVPTDDEKRGSWQLQEEYLAGRLGKNEEENGRLWNTATWMDKLLRIATKPAEALRHLNIYLGDKISQSTEGIRRFRSAAISNHLFFPQLHSPGDAPFVC